MHQTPGLWLFVVHTKHLNPHLPITRWIKALYSSTAHHSCSSLWPLRREWQKLSFVVLIMALKLSKVMMARWPCTHDNAQLAKNVLLHFDKMVNVQMIYWYFVEIHYCSTSCLLNFWLFSYFSWLVVQLVKWQIIFYSIDF